MASESQHRESRPAAFQPSSILIVEDSKGRREIKLDREVYSIGRDPKCDIRLASQFVSRHHATIVRLPGDEDTFYYRIVDGNLKGKPSANGMLINRRKLQAHDLKDGDEIVFGPQAQAVYYHIRREATATPPLDEFDVTLISPNMVDELEEGNEDIIGHGLNGGDIPD